MTTLRHNSPLGALQVPGVLGAVEPGEPFEVTDDAAARLLEQGDLYELVDGSASFYSEHTVPELRKLLTDRELPTGGRKDELIARLEEADTQQDGVADEPQIIAPDEPAAAETTSTEGDQQ